MPIAPPKPCRHPGCGKLVSDGSGYCPYHKRAKPGSFADKSRGTSKERGYGWQWQKLRELILKRDSGLCQPCLVTGRVTVATHVDHKKPKARGGTDDQDNLQAICVSCHKAKTDFEKNSRKGDTAPIFK